MSDFYNKYPYTDFHELNLDWVIERVKKLTEDWLATQEAWNNTQEQWQELYNYVHDYFDNLDVQEEINNKLDAMALDGSLADIVRPIVNTKVAELLPVEVALNISDTVADQIDPVVVTHLPDAVADGLGTVAPPIIADWLADHITQPTTPAVDTSLSVAGAAADAKVTGDRIRTIENNLFATGYFDKDSSIFTINPGQYAASSGWHSNADLNSYYFTAASDCVVYADNQTYTYYSICIYNGAVSSANYVARYRNLDNNLPTENAPLSVTTGQTVVVTINNHTDLGFRLYSDLATLLAGTWLDNEIRERIADNFNTGYYNKFSNIFTVNPGYYAAYDGWHANLDMISYYYTADEDAAIYADSENYNYYSICIYNGAVSSANFVARYRNLDNNLPLVSTPLQITSGQTVVVTINKRDRDFYLYSTAAPFILSDLMVNEVEDIAGKTTVEVDTDTYYITSKGITFTLAHTVRADINQDCWRFTEITKNGIALINGDITGVLLERGQADFMGGVHGDEIIDTFAILADGIPVNGTCKCDRVTIYLHSHLYRVNSPATNVVDRFVNITIEKGVMTTETTFKCLVNNFNVGMNLNNGLIGMFSNNIGFLSSNNAVADLGNMPADWNDSHDTYWYDVATSTGMIHIENIIGKDNNTYHAYVHNYSNETPPRFKVYMVTDENVTWNAGHVSNGKFVFAFI